MKYGVLAASSWCELALVRAPALPAQSILGGGIGREAEPPSEGK